MVDKAMEVKSKELLPKLHITYDRITLVNEDLRKNHYRH